MSQSMQFPNICNNFRENIDLSHNKKHFKLTGNETLKRIRNGHTKFIIAILFDA